MKRYLLFVFDQYYPSGGWNDFSGAFDTAEEATVSGAWGSGDYWHVIDLQTGKEVAYGKCTRS